MREHFDNFPQKVQDLSRHYEGHREAILLRQTHVVRLEDDIAKRSYDENR